MERLLCYVPGYSVSLDLICSKIFDRIHHKDISPFVHSFHETRFYGVLSVTN